MEKVGKASGIETGPHVVPPYLPTAISLPSLMEKVGKASGIERKKRILAMFIQQWREAHSRLHPTDANTTVSSQAGLSMPALQLQFICSP